MAMPIRETPILKGKHARKFILQIEDNKNKTVSKQIFERAKSVYCKIMQKQA